MIQKAIEKIRMEMDRKKDNGYIQAIGEMLLKQIEINRDAAEKIVNEAKTITSSLKEVETIAKKKAVGGCAVLSDGEVYGIVRKYYGFEAVQDKMLEVELEEIKEEYQVEEVKKQNNIVKVSFSASLDDYL